MLARDGQVSYGADVAGQQDEAGGGEPDAEGGAERMLLRGMRLSARVAAGTVTAALP